MMKKYCTLIMWAFVLAASTLSGCGDGEGGGGDSGSSTSESLERELPPEYKVLASHLGMSIHAETSEFRDDMSLTDIVAEGHSAILDLRAIDSSDTDIEYIATQAESAYINAVDRLERINALPKPPSGGEVFFESFVHGLYGNVAAGYAVGVEADRKQAAIAVEVAGLTGAIEKADAVHLLLPRVASRYAAPITENRGRIDIDVDEAWNAWGPHDWLVLYNTGDGISDCTIVVELKGKDGESRTNVHFVESWPGRSSMFCRYDPGTQMGDKVVGKMSVVGIESLTVKLLSPGYSTEVKYTYIGQERDSDIHRRIQEIKPHIESSQRNSNFDSDKVYVLKNKWSYTIYDITFRAENAQGTSLGVHTLQYLQPGGKEEIGFLEVSRNLRPGDKVHAWVGGTWLSTYTIR